jgi:S-DNA-T family DNA segregation ATPase FtsK/SpoIIIE
MAKSAPVIGRGSAARGGLGRGLGRHVNSWNELVAAFKGRLLEGAGSALVLVSFLLVVALLTYEPADPSLNTAADAAPANFLGRDGAFLADILVQGIGLAAFLIPVVLLGWAFRLLLQRPFAGMMRRVVLVLPALVLGAFACSVLRHVPLLTPMPAGYGGMVGWELLRLAQAVRLGPLELPLAMGAAAAVALLLLSIMGLSWGDWLAIGRGAGRGARGLALMSGYGTLAAAGFMTRRFWRWYDARRERAAVDPEPTPAVRALGPARPLPWMRTAQDRAAPCREARTGARAGEEPDRPPGAAGHAFAGRRQARRAGTPDDPGPGAGRSADPPRHRPPGETAGHQDRNDRRGGARQERPAA